MAYKRKLYMSANNANSLYEYIQTNYPDARNINQVTQVLGAS